jgi:hypothetical protein
MASQHAGRRHVQGQQNAAAAAAAAGGSTVLHHCHTAHRAVCSRSCLYVTLPKHGGNEPGGHCSGSCSWCVTGTGPLVHTSGLCHGPSHRLCLSNNDNNDNTTTCLILAACRRPGLEKNCQGVLDGQYGPAAAELIRTSGLLEQPIRLVINRQWDDKIDGETNLIVLVSSQSCLQCAICCGCHRCTMMQDRTCELLHLSCRALSEFLLSGHTITHLESLALHCCRPLETKGAPPGCAAQHDRCIQDLAAAR